METMMNLTDLLKHEILDLYSVEEQIIDALPKMIEKAKSTELKKALRDHLKVTEEQKRRLDKVKQTFGEEADQNGNKGFFSRLFGGGSGGEKCKGMAGIISEGEKIMDADITDEALDAAIIASAQKVEHYEICGYGTARAFARELKMAEVEQILTQTLNEEYAADDRLTSLAVGKLNIEAEHADGISVSGRSGGMRTSGNQDASSNNRTRSNSTSSKAGSSKKAGKSSGGNSSKGSGKTSDGSSSSSKSSSKSNASKEGTKSSGGNASKSKTKSSGGNASKGGSKTLSKGASSKSGTKSSGSSAKNGTSKSKGGTKGVKKSKRATSTFIRER